MTIDAAARAQLDGMLATIVRLQAAPRDPATAEALARAAQGLRLARDRLGGQPQDARADPPPRPLGGQRPDELRAAARRRLGRMQALLGRRTQVAPEAKPEFERLMREFWQLLRQADGDGRRGA